MLHFLWLYSALGRFSDGKRLKYAVGDVLCLCSLGENGLWFTSVPCSLRGRGVKGNCENGHSS